MSAPTPQNEREWLIVISTKLDTILDRLSALDDATAALEGRVEQLERFHGQLKFVALPLWALLTVAFGAWVKGLLG